LVDMFLSQREPGLSLGHHCSAGDNKHVAKQFLKPVLCGALKVMKRNLVFGTPVYSLVQRLCVKPRAEGTCVCVHMHQISLLGLRCCPTQGFHAKCLCPWCACCGALKNRRERCDSFRAGPTPGFLEPQLCPTEQLHHH